MANIELIKQKLPEELWKTAAEFTISDSFLEKESNLVILVLKSKSLAKAEEKQSWFNLVPMMNEDQMGKLRDILTREKDKIAEIESKYKKKKEEIEEKYQARFNAVEYSKKMSKMKNVESDNREKELEEADSLLDNL
jgi:conjugal transfer/entry exclusion protein